MFETTKQFLKNITHHSEEQDVREQAVRLIDIDVQDVYQELTLVPKNRIPCPTLAKRLERLVLKVDEMLKPYGHTCKDLPEHKLIEDAETERVRFTLLRYGELIETSNGVNPFGTFYELYHLYVQEVDAEEHPELKPVFDRAVRILFKHPAFENTLVERIDSKIHLLAENASVGSMGLHVKVHVFLDHYERFKMYNCALRKHPALESKMKQLEAAVTLQELTDMMHNGDYALAARSVDYINTWTEYLSALPGESQESMMDLIHIVDACSETYNEKDGT